MKTFIEKNNNSLQLKIIGKCVRKATWERFDYMSFNIDDTSIGNSAIEVITTIGPNKEIYVDKYWLRRNKNLVKSVRKFFRVHAGYTGDVFILRNFIN